MLMVLVVLVVLAVVLAVIVVLVVGAVVVVLAQPLSIQQLALLYLVCAVWNTTVVRLKNPSCLPLLRSMHANFVFTCMLPILTSRRRRGRAE
jgi:hypothetical protein